LQHFFGDHIFSSYTINSWKPEPDLFLHAAKQMGFLPKECLVIEDSMKGIRAGLMAKIKTVLFDPSGEQYSPKEVNKIDTMTKLRQLIHTINN